MLSLRPNSLQPTSRPPTEPDPRDLCSDQYQMLTLHMRWLVSNPYFVKFVRENPEEVARDSLLVQLRRFEFRSSWRVEEMMYGLESIGIQVEGKRERERERGEA